jgi:hypothetical protein
MGKDTIADKLVEQYGWKKYSFADPIKQVVNALFGWDERHAEGELKEVVCDVKISGDNVHNMMSTALNCGLVDFNFVPMDLIHVLVEHAFEKGSYKLGKLYNTARVSPRKAYQVFGTEYGRDQLDKDIWLKLAPKGKIVISDVRFENEASYIRDNGLLVFIDRDNASNEIDNATHISESGVVRYDTDYVLDNNGSLEDLDVYIHKLNNHYNKGM